MTDVERLLTQIEASCRKAREALAEEHEGDTLRSVTHIALDADKLHQLVAGW